MTEHRSYRNPEGGKDPFPGRDGTDHLREATETEQGPFERRRGTPAPAAERPDAARDAAAEDTPGAAGSPPDADASEAAPRRRWGRRKTDNAQGGSSTRSLARRFREPIIGLTLAGIAAPLINADSPASKAADTDDSGKEERKSDRPVAADRDLESEVGDYWADAEDEIVREQTIEGAMTRYEIDHELAETIYDYASKHEIEPDVAFGLVFTESTFRERAVSHVGARGLMQLMPRTAAWLEPGTRVRDLYDPDVNLDIGFRYLRQLIEKYEGDLEKALTAYNRGPGTVDRILKRGGDPDNGYAGKVMAG